MQKDVTRDSTPRVRTNETLLPSGPSETSKVSSTPPFVRVFRVIPQRENDILPVSIFTGDSGSCMPVYIAKERRRFECPDRTLPENSTESILHMPIETHVVFVTSELWPNLYGNLVEASPAESLARGLCIINTNDEELHICKFSTDVTGE